MSSSTIEPTPVLVTIDFSKYSEAVLKWGVDYVSATGAPLVLLHVVHDPVEHLPYGDEGADSSSVSDLEWQTIEEAAQARMDTFVDHAKESIPGWDRLTNVDVRLVMGVPTTRILEVADEEGASLIVMGSHGRTGLSHLLIGSKAEQIVRLSPIPVTIVKVDVPEEGERK